MADESTMRIPLRTCVRCGKPIVAGMKECFSCGAPVDEERKPDELLTRCPTCGKEITRGVIVCSLCGTRLRAERVPSSALSTSSSRPAPIPLTTLESASPTFPPLDKGPFLGISKRMGFRLGTVTFLLFGFLLGKVMFRGGQIESPAGERSVLPVTSEQKAPPALPPLEQAPPPAPVSPAPEMSLQRTLLKGRVVTADGLTQIRVFGPGATDAKRATTFLRDRVEEFLPSLRSVYGEKLTTTQQLLGTMVIELAITPEGKVAQVELHVTGLDNPDFLQMVRSLAQEWQFDAATGATTVFYPLLFTPTEIDPFSLIGLTKELMPGRYRMVGGEPTSVRLQPTAEGQEVGRVSPGLRLDVVGSQRGWLAVLSPKGKIGYVRRDAVFPRLGDEQPTS